MKIEIYLSYIAFLSATGAQSATINVETSTTCSTSAGTVSDSSTCNLASGGGSASATASAAFSISGNTLAVNLYDAATASGPLGGLPGPTDSLDSGYATASSSLSLAFLTAGPIRSGYIVESAGITGYGGEQGDSSTQQYGSSIGFGIAPCSGGGGADTGFSSSGCAAVNDVIIPVTLGMDYSFTGSASAIADGSGIYHSSTFGAAGFEISVEFFESDGGPVDAFLVTPEPASWYFLALGLVGVWGVNRRRVNQYVNDELEG